MGYLVAAYVVVVGGLALYGLHLWRQRRALPPAGDDDEEAP